MQGSVSIKTPNIQRFAQFAFPHWIFWVAILSLFAINAIWIGLSSRISIEQSWGPENLTLTAAAFAIILFRDLKSEKFDWFLHRLWCVLLFVLLSAVLSLNLHVFSHLLMTTNLPMADETLMRWDRVLGFDWLAYSKAITANPTFTSLLFFAYNEITFNGLAFVALVLIIINNRVRTLEILFLTVVTAFTCIVLSAPFPALATMQLFGDQELLVRLNIGTGVLHVEPLNALRSHHPILLSTDNLPGLISFPSFHTCMALIIARCSRGTILTTAMGSLAAIAILLGTPIFGGHYLVDVLSGAVIAFFTLWIWRSKIEKHVSPHLFGTDEKSFPLPKFFDRFALKN